MVTRTGAVDFYKRLFMAKAKLVKNPDVQGQDSSVPLLPIAQKFLPFLGKKWRS